MQEKQQTSQDSLFKKTSVNKDFSKLNKLFYGFPKTGKTTFASVQRSLDNREPLFIMTEEGHGALEVYAQKVTSWEGFLKLKDIIVKNKESIQKKHCSIVIDLISDLDTMCSEYIAQKNCITHLADLDFGKGWALQKQEFQSALRELLNVLPITFICHSQEKDLQWYNEKIHVQSPSLGKGALEFVNGKVDVIAWFVPANSQQTYPEITLQGSTLCIAGSRYPQLVKTFRFYPEAPHKTYEEMQSTFEKGGTK